MWEFYLEMFVCRIHCNCSLTECADVLPKFIPSSYFSDGYAYQKIGSVEMLKMLLSTIRRNVQGNESRRFR